MRLKTFYATTMTEAMQMVRDALGDNAIIVATREEQGGKRVRVTAAMDDIQDFDAPKNIHFEFGRYLKQAPTKPINREEENDIASLKPIGSDWLAYDEEEEGGGVAEHLSEILLRHAVPNEIMDTVLTTAMLVGGEDPRRVLTQSLGNLFNFQPDIGGERPIMLVGSPGTGKTLTAAKLAARAVLAGQRTAVITTDAVRAGGVEQLEAFTKILGIRIKTATSPKEMLTRLAEAQNEGAQRIIIDTGGTNPFDPEQMRDLAKYLQAAPVEAVFVLPGGLDAEESAEMARVYAILGVSTILPTRLDIARRLGGVLAAAHKGGMNFALGSDTPGVAEGLIAITPQRLASLLMPQAKKEDQRKKGTGTR